MGDISTTILVGNVGAKDANLKVSNNGVPYATFSLCTNQKVTQADGSKKAIKDWHKIVYWGKASEAIARYITKGRKVAVMGQNKTDEHGVTRVFANSVDFITK